MGQGKKVSSNSGALADASGSLRKVRWTGRGLLPDVSGGTSLSKANTQQSAGMAVREREIVEREEGASLRSSSVYETLRSFAAARKAQCNIQQTKK